MQRRLASAWRLCMTVYLLYFSLPIFWVLLPWPPCRLEAGARSMLLVVIAAGMGALIVGTCRLYEAVRRAGVGRVVFASSNHAVGFYPRSQTIAWTSRCDPTRAACGVSKAFAEALAALYADKHGVRSLCIRIGSVAERPVDVRGLSIWLSPRDLAQLVCIGLEHPEVHYEVVYGMSDDRRAWWDDSNARRLCYLPRDRSEDHAEEVLATCVAPGDSLPDRMQGGDFVATEEGGDPAKAPR